eukprot:gnl/Spiro4/276_TR168_c0_g1_i1.p1 gnl/Spiro4/276_TR168_c0_g1~~gnl/Spiro4/276_TR168_c0_g1_i1.p1  ORF type:complete len:314 (-),score=51.61 gnl/Spiro4/276_TR168_c0_g1_i1:66-1007(-)
MHRNRKTNFVLSSTFLLCATLQLCLVVAQPSACTLTITAPYTNVTASTTQPWLFGWNAGNVETWLSIVFPTSVFTIDPVSLRNSCTSTASSSIGPITAGVTGSTSTTTTVTFDFGVAGVNAAMYTQISCAGGFSLAGTKGNSISLSASAWTVGSLGAGDSGSCTSLTVSPSVVIGTTTISSAPYVVTSYLAFPWLAYSALTIQLPTTAQVTNIVTPTNCTCTYNGNTVTNMLVTGNSNSVNYQLTSTTAFGSVNGALACTLPTILQLHSGDAVTFTYVANQSSTVDKETCCSALPGALPSLLVVVMLIVSLVL